MSSFFTFIKKIYATGAGKSLTLTLPYLLRNAGWKEGDKVKIIVKDKNELIIQRLGD